MEGASQFSVGQTAQSLTCSIMEKPLTGLDDCLIVLQACFRKRMSGIGGGEGENGFARSFLFLDPLKSNQPEARELREALQRREAERRAAAGKERDSTKSIEPLNHSILEFRRRLSNHIYIFTVEQMFLLVAF